ncbi:GL22137 [Drosophila persimilis]|uniref:GL22137 n=1 Tax=Drosophila persimilis TaxID=7234 RepID=B4H6V9_DROPE|nr:GL22137 [Drosophila persimilis]
MAAASGQRQGNCIRHQTSGIRASGIGPSAASTSDDDEKLASGFIDGGFFASPEMRDNNQDSQDLATEQEQSESQQQQKQKRER